jgi:hypothetical protein
MAIGECVVSSIGLLAELRRLRQTGSVVEPEGRSHDDRVMAQAMGVHAWIEWERAGLRAAGRTWEAEHENPEKPAGDPVAQFLTFQINQDREKRAQEARLARLRAKAQFRPQHWSW